MSTRYFESDTLDELRDEIIKAIRHRANRHRDAARIAERIRDSRKNLHTAEALETLATDLAAIQFRGLR